MGCFLGCFGGAKESKPPRKRRVNRGSPQRQRNRVQKVQQELGIKEEQSITEKPKIDLVTEFLNKPEEEESQGPSLSPSPRKRVTFSPTITTYEHLPIHESIDSLLDPTVNIEQEIPKSPTQSHPPLSEDSNSSSVASSVASYPPNHRYHNSRYSDDEGDEYGDSDFDDVDDEFNDEDEFDDDDDDDVVDDDDEAESFSNESMESKTGDYSPLEATDEDVGSKKNPRERSDCIISVLSPVENLTQWKAAKTRGKYPQKENLSSNMTLEPISTSKPDQEISVDASLSTWLASPKTTPSRRSSGGGFEAVTSKQTASRGCNKNNSPVSYEDRPILGALTVEELRQISASNSPRKSPSPSPDEMPIIGTVGTYWNQSSSSDKKEKMVSDPAASYKAGIPNTTSKYREDKTVNWHSTPFETRLNRALNHQRV